MQTYVHTYMFICKTLCRVSLVFIIGCTNFSVNFKCCTQNVHTFVHRGGSTTIDHAAHYI